MAGLNPFSNPRCKDQTPALRHSGRQQTEILTVVLGGWLYRHTCFTAAKALRAERRRQPLAKEVL
ncbi:MAG: hypothetical protein DME19_04150 [Verrucomicrobia bacterium]|nr:MAG: hypothetical protein DME19_04150 [Verrucomicrobiota bacterium]